MSETVAPSGRVTMDAESFLEAFPDDSVDIIITDPPWRLNRDGGGGGRFKECADYPLLDVSEIARILGKARRPARKGAHLYTFAPAGGEIGGIIVGIQAQGWRLMRVLAWDRAVHRGLGAYRNAWEPVLIFSNGPARPYRMTGKYASLLRSRSPEYRTAKPWALYKVFLEMSSAPGELAIDPFCGLNPLQAAAAHAEGGRRWAAADVVDAADIRGQVMDRTRGRHNGVAQVALGRGTGHKIKDPAARLRKDAGGLA